MLRLTDDHLKVQVARVDFLRELAGRSEPEVAAELNRVAELLLRDAQAKRALRSMLAHAEEWGDAVDVRVLARVLHELARAHEGARDRAEEVDRVG